MCLSQAALSISYFASERRTALTGILDGGAAVSQQLADSSSNIEAASARSDGFPSI